MAVKPADRDTRLPPADLLPVGPRPTLFYRCLRLAVRPMLAVLFRVRVSGRENIPADGALVIAANHLGWIDSFLILLAFPPRPRVHFLGAVRGLVTHRVQWRVVRLVGGFIPVDLEQHADPRLYRHVDDCLARGGRVAFYPEGAFGHGGSLQPFRKGFAHFAVTAEVPVVPVALLGTDRLWFRRELRVVVDAPITESDVDALVAATRDRLSALTAETPPAGPRLHVLEGTLTHLF